MARARIENNHVEDIKNELENSTRNGLMKVGMQAVSDIVSQGDFPVDTGLLRNSITFALGGEHAFLQAYEATISVAEHGGLRQKKGYYLGLAPNTASTVYIGTNVEYAKYVEFGTSRMVARDFMFAPLRANLQNYKQILESSLKGL